MLILTAVGPDHPGMAHAVAQILLESGCNIEDTTMTRLSGQFSMIFTVEPPADLTLENLTEKLGPLRDSHGLTIDITQAVEVGSETEAPRAILTAYGPEKTGLLARLTGALAQNGVNVTDVQTRVASRGAVYVMIFELELPANVSENALEAALQADLSDLQINVRPLDTETL
jgi:glycine cleavage system transcriptional repressor